MADKDYEIRDVVQEQGAASKGCCDTILSRVKQKRGNRIEVFDELDDYESSSQAIKILVLGPGKLKLLNLELCLKYFMFYPHYKIGFSH
jgi:hypothetical protein